jgi:hypothetical protein
MSGPLFDPLFEPLPDREVMIAAARTEPCRRCGEHGPGRAAWYSWADPRGYYIACIESRTCPIPLGMMPSAESQAWARKHGTIAY